MIAPGLRVLAALRGGALLVGRPRGVVHIHSGSLTRSGSSVPQTEGPFCGTRSRRLRVLGRADDLSVLEDRRRRFCRSCTRRLPVALGVDSRRVLGSLRDEWMAAYAHLTVADLRTAADWSRSVEETHQVGRLALMLFGPKPFRPATTAGRELHALHEAVEKRRRVLADLELTDDERAARAARQAAQTADLARIQSVRRSAAALDKAVDRRNRGHYLLPHERQLLSST